MNMDERIKRIHQRADRLQEQKERRLMYGTGGASAFLLITLVIALEKTGIMRHTIPAELLTGSSLLAENTGGYILTAVLAFMAGAVLTTIRIKTRNK